MEWSEILTQIFEVCVIPLLGALVTFAIVWIKAKIAETQQKTDNAFLDSCLSILETTVINAIIATNQTYVEALKKQNAFTVEAQKEAFSKTYNAVIASLTEDTKKGLMTLTNDLSAYITEMIEAQINEQKKGG